jgi:hypothetical protein
MKDIVIVTAGDNSLHPAYCDPSRFDVLTLYWGSDAQVFERYKACSTYAIERRGLKFELVRSLTLLPPQIDFRKYRYVFLPDDDIAFPNAGEQIADMFHTAAGIDADIFQPAILNEHFSVAWEPTRRSDKGSLCRAVNIVELMMPAYSGPVFAEFVLPTLIALEFQRAGWGIEPFIAKIAETSLGRPLRTFVLDAYPAIHTRPVGGGSTAHEIGFDEAFLMPIIYSNRMKELKAFYDLESARQYRFPFVRDSTDMKAVEQSRAQIRYIRNLCATHKQSSAV